MYWLRHLARAAVIGLFVQAAVQVAVSDAEDIVVPDVPEIRAGGASYIVTGAGETGELRIEITPSEVPGPDGAPALAAAWSLPVRDPHGGLTASHGGAMLTDSGVYEMATSYEESLRLRQALFAPGTLPCGILLLHTPTCLSPDGPLTQEPGRWDGMHWTGHGFRASFREDVPFADEVWIGSWHMRLRSALTQDVESVSKSIPDLRTGDARNGVDDASEDGFTMQAAWHAALEAPFWPDLRRYLDEHPDARMTAARPWEDGWSFEVGGPWGGASFTAKPRSELAFLGPVFDEWEQDTVARPRMPILADAESILERAAAWTDVGLEQVAFAARCDGDCSQAAITYIASGPGAQVRLDGQGRPTFISEQREAEQPTPLRLAPVAPVEPAAAVRVAAQTGAVAAVAYLVGVLVKAPLAGLFSRVSRANALHHDVRASILAAVEADPGIHPEELRRRLELSPGQMQHHLGVLLRERIVIERRDGRMRRLFHPEEQDQRPRPSSPGAKRILEVLAGRAATRAEIAKATSLHPSTVGYHLRRLAQHGCVHEEDGRWQVLD